MAKNIKVEAITTKADLKRFIMFSWEVYRGNPNWVAPLIIDQKKLLDQKNNPFYEHSQIQNFLAYSNGEIVGRISAIINDNHNKFHNEKTGFFGFYESHDDPDVCAALFDAAENWIRDRGMDRMRGPVNPSTNDNCGLLIDAFDQPAVVMMSYNPSYYVNLFEHAGLQKSKDLFAYYLDKSDINLKKIERVINIIRKKMKVTIRYLNMKQFKRDVDLVKEIYNEAWERNWGFVPMTDAEIDHMAKGLKPVVVPELAMFALVDGEPVGFSLAVPDMNQALIKINGRLFPFGLPRVLWHSRKIDMLRVIITGLRKDFRKTGIDGLFYYETYARGVERGFSRGEFSWILEDNLAMRHALENLGAHIYKTYRIYDKELNQG
jgi:GNAT superfamily N-acetyltransferase